MYDFRVYYEDVEVGHKDTYGAKEVTAEEIIAFATDYDPQLFHLDDDAAKLTPFGGLCASGWHTGAMAMRMMVDRLHETGLACVGSPGLEDLKWRKPVFPGDILSVTLETKWKKESESRPNLGLIGTETTVTNQKGEKVMTHNSVMMILRRPQG